VGRAGVTGQVHGHSECSAADRADEAPRGRPSASSPAATDFRSSAPAPGFAAVLNAQVDLQTVRAPELLSTFVAFNRFHCKSPFPSMGEDRAVIVETLLFRSSKFSGTPARM
jgi:hypothetical protein